MSEVPVPASPSPAGFTISLQGSNVVTSRSCCKDGSFPTVCTQVLELSLVHSDWSIESHVFTSDQSLGKVGTEA
jgi:hypothetical protein